MAVKAPVVGGTARDVELEDAVFAAEVKPHLVHEAVRAELNADRAGTRGAKSRGMVSGGRTKAWRQNGTGRALQGTTRAPQWKGGGVVFPPGMRSFEVKVNRKAKRAALRAALSDHVKNGTLGLLDGSGFDEPSTRQAADLLSAWGQQVPTVVVSDASEEALHKSFRNIDRVVVTVPGELEVAQVVWARSLLVTQGALEELQGRAQ